MLQDVELVKKRYFERVNAEKALEGAVYTAASLKKEKGELGLLLEEAEMKLSAIREKFSEVETRILKSEAELKPMQSSFESAKTSYEKASAALETKRKVIEDFEKNMRVLDAEFDEKQGWFRL